MLRKGIFMKLNGIQLTWLGHSTSPMHYGTFPLLTGTPEALRQLTQEQAVEVVELKPGETLS